MLKLVLNWENPTRRKCRGWQLDFASAGRKFGLEKAFWETGHQREDLGRNNVGFWRFLMCEWGLFQLVTALQFTRTGPELSSVLSSLSLAAFILSFPPVLAFLPPFSHHKATWPPCHYLLPLLLFPCHDSWDSKQNFISPGLCWKVNVWPELVIHTPSVSNGERGIPRAWDSPSYERQIYPNSQIKGKCHLQQSWSYHL